MHKAAPKNLHHHYHSPWKRGFFSLGIVTVVMAVGTVGMHSIERMPWIKAFYFMSMLATAQGPMIMPETNAGLLFASFMSFISIGIVVTALGFLFGPFFGQLWHLGVHKVEEDFHLIKKNK